MGLAGKLAKKAGKAAGNAVVKKVNGGCPGSRDGKHNFKAHTIKKDVHGKKVNNTVVYCGGCGRAR